jgi:hypothetical protein
MIDAIATGVAAIAAFLGAGLGMIGLLAPDRAAKIVRLIPDPAMPGGQAEFRASYGGLFLAGHAVPFGALVTGSPAAALLCLPLAAAWFGAAIGRVVSINLDDARTGYNWFSVGFEAVLGLALLAPLLADMR